MSEYLLVYHEKKQIKNPLSDLPNCTTSCWPSQGFLLGSSLYCSILTFTPPFFIGLEYQIEYSYLIAHFPPLPPPLNQLPPPPPQPIPPPPFFLLASTKATAAAISNTWCELLVDNNFRLDDLSKAAESA